VLGQKRAKPATAETVDGLRDSEPAGGWLESPSTTTALHHQIAPLAEGERENLRRPLQEREKVRSKVELGAAGPPTKSILFRDYETRSTLNLSEVGAWRYAAHHETNVWCCAYAVNDGPIKLWVPGDPIPPEFIEAAQNPNWIVSAFNDQFERLIEQQIMGPRYCWPTIAIDRHRCTQAMALALALPAKLEMVARALNLEEQKDMDGHKLMLQMARPRPARAGEDLNGVYWSDDPEHRERLGKYCVRDVTVERAIHNRIKPLSSEEQSLWALDAKINDRGIFTDGKLLEGAISIAEAAQIEINAELRKITEGEIETVNQTKIKEWLWAHGCRVTDIQKATLQKALKPPGLPATTRRVIELRLDGAHAAAAKLQTIRDWRNPDGRIRGAFKYHGASTGRWTSLDIQVQNMKRPTVADLGTAIDAVATGDFNYLRRRYSQPMSVVGDITRAMFCARPGHRLITADFSGVESRITAWVSGQQPKLDQWAKFDRTQAPEDEPYFILGSKFGFPPEQARVVGKTADLAFGYMGAVGAWRKLAPPDDTSTEADIKQRQQAWRNAHPETVRFWRSLERAAIKAMQNPGTPVPCNRVAFRRDKDFLFMRLPSGREIAYPFPRLKTDDRGNVAVVFKDYEKGKWVDCRQGRGAYGGTWCENAVQAVARDIFAAAMSRLESAGYSIVLHVHDEICAEVPVGFGSAEEFLRILTTPPSWADGLPIAAKVREGDRFCKISATPTPEHQADDAVTPAAVVVGGEVTDEEATPTVVPDSDPKENHRGSADDPDESHRTNGDDPDESHRGSGDGPGHGRGENEHAGYASGERQWGRNIATYDYRDENGAPYLRVTRTSGKQFPQAHWQDGRWVWGKPAGPKIPYRLPDLLAGARATPVFICEGEKDADNVATLGLIATTNSEGAGKWTTELNKWFAGKQTVYIREDNDEAGRSHAAKVASALQGIVPEIRVVSLPELPDHGDVSDWLKTGGTKAQLLELAKNGKPPGRGYTLVRASDIVPRASRRAWRFASCSAACPVASAGTGPIPTSPSAATAITAAKRR
jgi:DNA polymerase bacteriophage-type